METKLKKLVLEGFYHEAENLMLTIPLNAQRDIIMDLAYEKVLQYTDFCDTC